MNLIKVLHETAMEYVDFADRAKHKGDINTYETLIKKAYVLEKEAALKMYYQAEGNSTKWRYILLKSAGWLAFQAGKQDEAIYFAELGLNNQPSKGVALQFQDLLNKVNTNTIKESQAIDSNQKEITIQIKGILTQANAAQKEIYLKSIDNQQTYSIRVPEALINDIVKSFWSATVMVEGKTNPLGVITLETIRLAA